MMIPIVRTVTTAASSRAEKVLSWGLALASTPLLVAALAAVKWADSVQAKLAERRRMQRQEERRVMLARMGWEG